MSTSTTPSAPAGTSPGVPAQPGPPPDPARAEAFAEQMLGVLNSGMLTLMVSVGHRTGLFDSLSALPAADSSAIAEAAGLQERYVREWLGAMTTGRIVEHDAEAGTYRLPSEHAAFLTRSAGPENMASFAQFVAMLGKVEDQVVECFRSGGGVPYSAFPEFQRLMAEDSGQVFDATLIDQTLPLVPGLPEQLSSGIDVADVGCGSGHAVNLMARAFPSSRFVGFDVSEEGVAAAEAEAEAWGLSNTRFEVRDVATLSGRPAFDLVTTFDAVHDQADPERVLQGIHEMLRPGGTYLCVDIQAATDVAGNVDHPLGPFLYTISCMHCMTVSLAQGGRGLGTMWGEQQALQMLDAAGFRDVDVRTVPGDIQNSYYICRRP
jgi:2-polyprenyl-3-methyl-5-hydroxy-6-metoxy-1,4-benzoquinol methylase